jgi:hypothetical protein
MTHTADTPQKTPPQSEVQSPLGFTEIGVSGFRSFAEETRIQLGSLTILAGANSSGKSSIMQPLLLMKQTLEAPYDPGVLLLDGPNVSFTSSDQFLTKFAESQAQKRFSIYLADNQGQNMRSIFNWMPNFELKILEQSFLQRKDRNTTPNVFQGFSISEEMSEQEIKNTMQQLFPNLNFDTETREQNFFQVKRFRCFLGFTMGKTLSVSSPSSFHELINSVIHLPGLRDGPQRFYKMASNSGNVFAGRFESYFSSIIEKFQDNDPSKIIKLQESLRKLGLADRVQAERINEAHIRIRVGRVLGQNNPADMVDITDVGFGVSQALPVIVALLVAQPGQLVYIEQPEIHLHPRAQVALAEIFAEAASRGVRVVVETHSELFLMGIQALVAEDKLDAKAVKLHWFTRQADGSSKVTSAELDETGAFGDWPEDFGSTTLGMANRYLSAAETKIWQTSNGH